MNLKKSLCLALLVFLTVPAFSQWVNMKDIKVATLNLVSRVAGEDIDTATLSEMIQVALVDKHAFLLVERSLITKVLAEQEFQATGLTDTQIARVGAMAGANKILSMSISKLGGEYIMILRSIDTSSAVVDLSDQIQSPSVAGFIELIPVLADRFVRKARGEAVGPYGSVEAAAGPHAAPQSPAATEPASAAATGIPRLGLISEFTFDGAIKDGVGRRLTSQEDVTLGKDRFGKGKKAAWFNGKTSRINAGKIFNQPVESFSVSAWFYIENFNHPPKGVIRGIILSNWNNYRQDAQRGMEFGYFLNMDERHGFFNSLVCDGKADNGANATPVLPLAEFEKKYRKRWIHACLVVSGGVATTYLEGAMASSVPTGKVMVPDPETPFWIGHSGIDYIQDKSGKWNQINFFSGAIDSLRVYDRALSDSEILALFEEAQ